MAAKTQIAKAVESIFALNIQENILAMGGKEFKFGTHAEQDYRVLESQFWSLMAQGVSLMPGAPKPLQDQPKSGSLESEEARAGMPDSEYEVQRKDALKRALLAIALVNRHIESLEKQAKSDMEEAGKKSADGGRIRFSIMRERQFKAYHVQPEQWVIDRKAELHPADRFYESQMARYDQMLDELKNLPLVDAQQATDFCNQVFGSDEVEKTVGKAWDRLMDNLAAHYDACQAVEKLKETYAKSGKTSKEDSALYVRELNLLRSEEKIAKKAVTRSLEATPLLAATESIDWLVKSADWRLKQSEIDLANLEAEAREQEVKLATQRNKLRMMDLMDQQDAMDAEMADMKARMEARRIAREAREKAAQS